VTPQLLPSISADQETNIASSVSLPVSCAALPASGEPLQSYVACTMKPVAEDNTLCADGNAYIAETLSVRYESVEGVIESCESAECKGSNTVDSVLTVMSADATESHCGNTDQSKVCVLASFFLVLV